MIVLILNAGSSSLKFGLFEGTASPSDSSHSMPFTDWRSRLSGLIDWKADPDQAELVVRLEGGDEARSQVRALHVGDAVGHAIRAIRTTYQTDLAIEAIGQRVVHGGSVFRQSQLIDDRVKTAIQELAELAPLHNPPALESIRAAESTLPGAPQVAVFDTAFYADLQPHAYVYPLPYEWLTQWGIRRFGFHGISHAYCVERSAELLEKPVASLRIISCHLGNGCSATATRNGFAVATTMGFTPLDGLMMGTRPGSIDAGILIHVLNDRGVSVERLDDLLNHASGLLGVSGLSSDFREVQEAASKGHERANLALKIYASRVREAIASLAVTMGGADAVVFTAGVGENSSRLRAMVCEGLECLGVAMDPARNGSCVPDADIATSESNVRILVIHTREELLIARETMRVVKG